MPDTISTLDAPADEMVTFPFATGICTLLVPLAIPVIPAVAKSWEKLLLVLPNAVRNGSPRPSLGAVPTLIIC